MGVYTGMGVISVWALLRVNTVSDALDLERAMYFSNAFTGQTEWCDGLRNRSTPKRNGSVLDFLMCS